MKIVMTFVVRDEADVLEVNLRVHRALGVDAFAVLDNGSTDGTAEILARWREAGLAHVTTDPAADTDEVFRQWQTRLAKLAASELGADWVINNDGDEFWWPLTGNLKEAFAAVPPESNGILAPRLEFVPRPDGPEPWWERMTLRERHTRVLPKMAHRSTFDVRVGPGSHHVISPTLGVGETAGKPSLRGLRNRPEQPAVIAPASEFSCAIFHLPLRSFEQYRTRLGIGLRIAQTRESEQLEAAHQRGDRRGRRGRPLARAGRRRASGCGGARGRRAGRGHAPARHAANYRPARCGRLPRAAALLGGAPRGGARRGARRAHARGPGRPDPQPRPDARRAGQRDRITRGEARAPDERAPQTPGEDQGPAPEAHAGPQAGTGRGASRRADPRQPLVAVAAPLPKRRKR